MKDTVLTICSVNHHSKRYLEVNVELTNTLNPSVRPNWLIVDNSPPELEDFIISNQSRVRVVKGFQFDPSVERPASYHHGIALNEALKYVQTKYVLILDPDFFIIKRNWICEVQEHMKHHMLAFFGAPWHPRWFTKYRYFPCVHCMFIDLEKINKRDLDFTPGIPDTPNSYQSSIARARFFSLFPRLLKTYIRAHRSVGSSDDTGYRIYKRYYQSEYYLANWLKPVFKPKIDMKIHNSRMLSKSLFLEVFLPERFSIIPHKKGYFSSNGFREAGFMSARSKDWEEFLWNEKPFGFHVRGFMKKQQDLSLDIQYLKTIIDDLTS